MKTILLTQTLSIVPLLWIIGIVALGVVSYILKTAPELDDNGNPVKNNSINHNIQSMNKMGYHPEEDDELTGYEHVERPHVENKNNTL